MATIETTGGAEYTYGAAVELKATIKKDGSLVDPSTVTLIIEEPDGTETTISTGSLTNPSVGVWTYEHTIDQVGIHEYRWKTTSPIGAKESYFVGLASRVANP